VAARTFLFGWEFEGEVEPEIFRYVLNSVGTTDGEQDQRRFLTVPCVRGPGTSFTLIAVLARLVLLGNKAGDIRQDFLLGIARGDVLGTIPIVGLDGKCDQSFDFGLVAGIAQRGS
jgi:hypothetical protein